MTGTAERADRLRPTIFVRMGDELQRWLIGMGMDRHAILQLAFGSMIAILFLQSGLDKLFNWKGEKEFLTGHFAKSILKGTVPLLLPVITLIECCAGACSAIGVASVLSGGGTAFGLIGALLGTKAIVLLFFGQRVAKDYAGAASLIPYFLMCVGGLWTFMPG